MKTLKDILINENKKSNAKYIEVDLFNSDIYWLDNYDDGDFDFYDDEVEKKAKNLKEWETLFDGRLLLVKLGNIERES